MTGWTQAELEQIGAVTELELSSYRPDGTLRSPTTMWVVEVDGSVFVRSAGGPDRPWYARARASESGRIRTDSVERIVTFKPGVNAPHDKIDVAYHAKYDRYGASIVGSVVGQDAVGVTLLLDPAD